MKTALSVHDVSKTFKTRSGTVEAVHNVSFSVQQGEVIALLGENGAGKSTLIDMLLGLSSPSTGSVELFGTTPSRAVRASRVAAVLQTGGLLKDLSVKDQVAMVAATYPTRPDVSAALVAAGIADIAGRKIGKCSGGQQQKVKFAIALLGNPDLLILDEPTTGMDVNARAVFWKSMHAQAKLGKTIIFATHYLEEAEEFADRIVMMAHGELIADGTVDDLRARAGSRTVKFRLADELDGAVRLALSDADKQRWGIEELNVSNGVFSLRCSEVENFLRYLLPHYPIQNLEISHPTLSEAFSLLTD